VLDTVKQNNNNNKEKAKEKRKLNVIVHGISKSKPEEPLERKAYDIEQVNVIIQKHFEVDVAVDNAIRLGKKVNDKCRLLKITISNESVKKQIMQSASMLQKDPNPDWMKKVFIAPDRKNRRKTLS